MAGEGRRLRVLPDAGRVEEAMLRAAADGPAFVDGAGYLTFTQLVEALGEGAAVERRPCPPLTARVIVWACARKLGEGPFGSFVQEPAFARAALELFFELKSGGVEPAGFRAAVATFPAGRMDRALYLSRLYEAYEARLSELKLCDREDLVLCAIRSLRERGLPPGLRASGIELSGIHDFSWARQTLVEQLAHACDAAGVELKVEVPAGLSADVDAVVDPVLGAMERSAQTLTHVELAKEDLSLDGRPLAWLGRHLFSAAGAPGPGAAPLTLLRAATVRQEAQLFARIARQKVDEGIPPERIALVWPDLAEEAEWSAEALERYGVPARMRRGLPLSATAPGRIALELPLVVDDGFPAAEVGWLLESRYLPDVSRRAPEGPRALLALASVRDDVLGAVDGRGAYDVRLSQLLLRMEARGAKGRRVEEVRALRDASMRLISIGGRIPAEGKAGELLEAWWHALEELGLPRAVRQTEGRGQEGTTLGRAVLRALARDQAAFEALHGMARELRAALRDANAQSARMTRRTFQRWLVDAAGDFNLAPRGPRGGAVQLLDVRELPGRAFAHVCLGGLADGRFPGREPPHPLFPEEDRLRVNAWHRRDVFRVATGEGERRIGWRLAEDRLLLHLALSASEGGVTCAYPAHTGSGSEQAASPFWDELQRLTGKSPEVMPLRPVPALDDVLSDAELRERTALELFGRPELRTSQPDPAGPALGAELAGEPWLAEAAHLSRVEGERLAFFGDAQGEREVGPFSGLARRDGLQEALGKCFEFGKDRPLSASLLQKFGNCAFQGFLAWGLRLDEPEEPGEEMDARGQGSFWHKVLEVLFPALKAQGLLGAAPGDVPDAVIDGALDAAATDAERTGHTGHPALWRIGRERARGMVRRILSSSTRGLPFHYMEPVHPELRFGRADAPEGWQQVPIPGPKGEPPVYVEGKIDRLDAGNGALGVVDYKSGTVTQHKALREAFLKTEFQLPLYLHAARVSGHEGPLRAAWLSLKDGEPVDLETELAKMQLSLADLLATDPATCARLEAEGLQSLSMAVHRLVAGLREGKFPARPEDCGFCSYQRVCRVSERRLPEGEE
jgi:ATP-dependent helicase/nuclease subunit B